MRIDGPTGGVAAIAGTSPGLPGFSSASWKAALLAMVHICAGCQATIQPPSTELEGRLRGNAVTGQPATDTVLELKSDPSSGLPRISYDSGGAIYDVRQLEVHVTANTGLPQPQQFVFLSVSRVASTQPTALTDVAGWVARHHGELVAVPIRQDDISLASRYYFFPPPSPRRQGMAALALVEDDDKALPWRRLQSDTNAAGFALPCQVIAIEASWSAAPPGETVDCFDLETLARMFFVPLAVQVHDAVRAADLDQATSIIVQNHRLHAVPFIPKGGAGQGGFGLIYTSEVKVSFGLKLGELKLYIPLSFIFDFAGADLVVDPLSAGDGMQNLARVTVEYSGVAGLTAAEEVRAAILPALDAFAIPTIGETGIGKEQQIVVAINETVGRNASEDEPNSAAFLLPEGLGATAATFSTEVFLIPTITTAMPPVPGMDVTPSTTANAAGAVTLVRVSGTGNAALAFTTTIAPISVGQRYRLVISE
jgi:hypothetical protein